jgi:hypothetical protein
MVQTPSFPDLIGEAGFQRIRIASSKRHGPTRIYPPSAAPVAARADNDSITSL